MRDKDETNMTIQNTEKEKINEQLMEEQRQIFVATLGHDLKNPIIAQIKALELLLKGFYGKVDPNQTEILEMILDSCRYMYAMLNSLLITYKNDKGIIKLKNDDVSIFELAKECIDELIYFAKDKNVKIVILNSCCNDIVCGDKIQIKRVIINLILNGIKYAYPKSEMKINVYNENNYTCFSFENSSPYIPQEKQDAIFERYVSYTNNKSLGGTGLGLYSSKKIIEAHNGNIFVKSYKNNKNIFGFSIPNDIEYKNVDRYVYF